jgi:predicted RNA-binding protein YlxR (DUF448 family)
LLRFRCETSEGAATSSIGQVTAPIRMCAGCRGRAAKAELLRIVARDGIGVVDESQTEPGRGVYLHPRPECLEQAVKRRSMGRLLRAEIDGPRTAAQIRIRLGQVT